jgi:beta-mannosidase
VLAPVAVWSTDEGLDGVGVHVANDLPAPLRATLRIALYRDLEIRVDEARHDVELEPHSSSTHNVEAILGRFVDVSWAYRFGAPAQDLIAISLEREDGELLSQCFRLLAGRPTWRETPERLGVDIHVQPTGEDSASLTVSSERFLYGVRPSIPGFCPEDDAFCVEPGRPRTISIRRTAAGGEAPQGSITALNLDGRVPIDVVVPA